MEAGKIDRRIRPDWLKLDQWTAPDGWPLRRFHVAPAPETMPRGNLLFQTGRADFIEKYIESFDHWRRDGWAIEGFDWRGQGGSGRVLDDCRVGHCPPFEDMEADLVAYCGEWDSRTAGPHIVLGHSMGGHLVLKMLTGNATSVDGAVLLSPMLGLNTGLIGERLGRLIARTLCRIGLTERPAWSEDGNKGSGHRQRNLTHSVERYEDELWLRAEDPMLDVGPPTWGWLRDSWKSIAGLLAPGVLEHVTTPMLILCAERDPLVMTPVVKLAARRLPRARLLCHPNAAHELLRESDEVRLWALEQIDHFLAEMKATA